MKFTLEALLGIIIKPKKTLIDFPSDKVTLPSLLIVLLSILASIFQELQLINQYKFSWSIFLPTIIEVFFYFIFGTAIVYAVLFVIRKTLSFIKIFNILTITQAPRLLFSVPVIFLYLQFPELQDFEKLNKTLNFMMLLFYVYAFFLFIIGLIINIKQKNITN